MSSNDLESLEMEEAMLADPRWDALVCGKATPEDIKYLKELAEQSHAAKVAWDLLQPATEQELEHYTDMVVGLVAERKEDKGGSVNATREALEVKLQELVLSLKHSLAEPAITSDGSHPGKSGDLVFKLEEAPPKYQYGNLLALMPNHNVCPQRPIFDDVSVTTLEESHRRPRHSMNIVSMCPFATSTFDWRTHFGAVVLTLIVKSTYVLQPGKSVLAAEQEPVRECNGFWIDAPYHSVRIPSDLVPYKPRADVMLVGRAYAPNKQPTRSVMTRLVVGGVDKSIEVWCDRAFRIRDGQLLEGPRFIQMPLCWERAAGGHDSINPLGMRFDAPPNPYGMIAIPNLQPPGIFISKRSDVFAPIGYGPVARDWPERARLIGNGPSFFEGKWQDRPMPPEVDLKFFQSAPPDQHTDEIRPDERIVLENLHPEYARLVTNLPGIRPRAVVDRATGEREEITLVGDTLWIDTDRGICCVVWRGCLRLRDADEGGQIFVMHEHEHNESAPIAARHAGPRMPITRAQYERDMQQSASLGPLESDLGTSDSPTIQTPSPTPPNELHDEQAADPSETSKLFLVAEGLPPAMVDAWMNMDRQALFASLAPREQEIAMHLAETSDSLAELAAKLDCSYATIRTQVERIFRHLGIRSRPELVEFFDAPMKSSIRSKKHQ